MFPPTKDFVESTMARNTERVWEYLMNDDVRQIGLYGMGGVGKTTIMKHIYNQLWEKKDKFDIVYWVTVSKAFSITKLQRDIAKALNLSLRDDDDESTMSRKIFGVLSRKRKYVLILDDLWESFDLDKVGIPEPTHYNGCKIVLTTRSMDVCRMMDCKDVKVELLTEQEALTLFLKKAVVDNMELAPKVYAVATKIAEECARLPLAIVTVAGSLRGLKEAHEWRNALNQLISLTKDASDGQSKVFEQLKFSYSRLGNKVLQDCFLYCSLYPEDHDIPVKGLIEYWIAEGFIAEDSVEAEFDKGYAILGTLTRTCLLEGFTEKYGGKCLRMHDLIRDMAIIITRTSPRFIVKAGEDIESISDEVWSNDIDRMSFMYCQIKELPIRAPVCPRLTTLLLSFNPFQVIPDSFFTNMHCLEVLDLSRNEIMSLPKSISNLENLHAIILAYCTALRYVPSVEKLKALKMFILTCSQIKEVPKGIEELVKLRKLDLSDNQRLRTFPGWKLRRLSKLQYLRIDGTQVKVSAEDLICMRQLKVVAIHFYNIQELARYVTSQQCQGLEKYCLLVGERFSETNLGKEVRIISKSNNFGSRVDQLVLPADVDVFQLEGFHDLMSLSDIPSLKDARDLHKCGVRCCNGLESIFSSSTFSEDGQISLESVESLDLSYLPRFRGLFDWIGPTPGMFFNLKELSFMDCPTMKNIFPIEFLQNFPNLETLRVSTCTNLEDIIVGKEEMSDWSHHRDDSNVISLPKLKILNLNCLPRLKSIYEGVMMCKSIMFVEVEKCPMLRRLPLSLPTDTEQATILPSLKYIKGDKGWWESLEWDHPLTKTLLQPYFQAMFGGSDISSLLLPGTVRYPGMLERAVLFLCQWYMEVLTFESALILLLLLSTYVWRRYWEQNK